MKRYKKHFNLEVKAESKTELLEAVGKHFATMPVHETQVAIQFYHFIHTLRNKRLNGAIPSTSIPTMTTTASGCVDINLFTKTQASLSTSSASGKCGHNGVVVVPLGTTAVVASSSSGHGKLGVGVTTASPLVKSIGAGGNGNGNGNGNAGAGGVMTNGANVGHLTTGVSSGRTDMVASNSNAVQTSKHVASTDSEPPPATVTSASAR